MIPDFGSAELGTPTPVDGPTSDIAAWQTPEGAAIAVRGGVATDIRAGGDR